VGADVSSRGFRSGIGFADLDPTTTPLTFTSLGNVSVTSAVVPEVPELATFVLLGLGMFGLPGYRWRFKK